jgi:hypothetical protein
MSTKPPEDPISHACRMASASINRSFIVTQFVKESIDELHAQIKLRKKKRLRVTIPSYDGKLMEVMGTKEEINAILAESLESTIYQQAYIASVSIVEDCLTTCLRQSLRKHPQKLNLSIDGEKAEKTVSLDLVINAADISSLIDGLISTRILKIMYDRPANYFKHLKAIAGIELESAIQQEFIEIKASRDVFVHNQSIANLLYVEKSGSRARAKVDEKLPITEIYFKDSMTLMKKVIIEIYKAHTKE